MGGDQGPDGPMGTPGDKGPVGLPGPRGPTGEPGSEGYQGFSGQQGATGGTGYTGNLGPIGDKGLMGKTGLTGSIGDSGVLGETGAPGHKGPRGVQGPPGLSVSGEQAQFQSDMDTIRSDELSLNLLPSVTTSVKIGLITWMAILSVGCIVLLAVIHKRLGKRKGKISTEPHMITRFKEDAEFGYADDPSGSDFINTMTQNVKNI